ncbi:MAG: hypothetical protein P4L84_17980 [Isosphaeraceae bacterium]|nr:hypothetical protein [Isosphaeraceae bacterium]
MDLLSSTLNAVGQVGSTLDKYTGGRAVRGALAGKPRELASVIPFSDTLGLTNEHDATSGRDLLDHYGVTAKGDNSLGAHAAGFLADNVLSPANWLGAGAAFKAAPTLAKGLSSGAKALSGLDLIDHIGAGAKGVATAGKNFLANDAGSLKIPDLHSAIMAQMGHELPYQRAIRLGDEAGVPTGMVDAKTAAEAWAPAGLDEKAAGRIAAWYNPVDHNVNLNDATPTWRNNDLMEGFMRGAGPTGTRWYSTSDPNGIFNHELGHAWHREAIGPDAFVGDPKLAGFPFDHSKYVGENLSRYGATNPHEAIAEMVAALKGGQEYDAMQKAGLSKILWNYGGKTLWQRLGDEKLLKPLGYSLMGGAALGSAADQMQEA